MKARDVQNWLHTHKRDTYSVLLPNYTPRQWHECDLFGVTKAGYFHEFEIKLSVSDFRADAKKKSQDRYEQPVSGGVWQPWQRIPGKKKHERLAIGDAEGPARFWYVVPHGLVAVADVPAWAGLMFAKSGCEDDRFGFFEVVKEAPKLHSTKVDRAVLRHAINVCYYRFWGERHELERLNRMWHELHKIACP